MVFWCCLFQLTLRHTGQQRINHVDTWAVKSHPKPGEKGLSTEGDRERVSAYSEDGCVWWRTIHLEQEQGKPCVLWQRGRRWVPSRKAEGISGQPDLSVEFREAQMETSLWSAGKSRPEWLSMRSSKEIGQGERQPGPPARGNWTETRREATVEDPGNRVSLQTVLSRCASRCGSGVTRQWSWCPAVNQGLAVFVFVTVVFLIMPLAICILPSRILLFKNVILNLIKKSWEVLWILFYFINKIIYCCSFTLHLVSGLLSKTPSQDFVL